MTKRILAAGFGFLLAGCVPKVESLPAPPAVAPRTQPPRRVEAASPSERLERLIKQLKAVARGDAKTPPAQLLSLHIDRRASGSAPPLPTTG